MPGFYGIFSKSLKVNDIDLIISNPNTPLQQDIHKVENGVIKRFVLPKFLGDRLFSENDVLFVCTDGTILNSNDLRQSYGISNNLNLFSELYKKGINFLVNELRGDFCGVLYDKESSNIHIFTNHLASKPVFYFLDEKTSTLVFATELKVVVKILRQLGYRIQLSEEGAWCLLTYGFMIEDRTLVQGVKKLLPGTILSFENFVTKIQSYFSLRNEPDCSLNQNDIIDGLHERFSVAVDQEYRKDIEYGYGHVATLSGGMDSRTSIAYALGLGYRRPLAVTCATDNYPDQKIAQQIALDWGCEFLFYSLGEGDYLKNITAPVYANDGLVFLTGSAHVLALLTRLQSRTLGMMHTGLVGDGVMANFLKAPLHQKKNPYGGSVSSLLRVYVEDIARSAWNKYENDELFLFANRAINGVFNGYMAIQQFTDFASPFLHVDFLNFALSIEPKYRYHSYIYLKWVDKWKREVLNYKWERTGFKPNAMPILVQSRRIIRGLRKKITGQQRLDNMVPLNYWFRTNQSLREVWQDYFEHNIGRLSHYPEIEKATRKLYSEGSCQEKGQALTLVAACQLHDLA